METFTAMFMTVFNAYPWTTFLVIYFFPTILNFFTKKCYFSFIFWFNLTAGWTILGWLLALLDATTGYIPKDEQAYSMEYHGNHWIRGGKKKRR